MSSKNKMKLRTFLFILIIFALIAFLTYHQFLLTKPIFWGAWISADTYGRESNPPWDPEAIDIFEQHAGKKISILHWGQPWWHCNARCDYQLFDLQKAQYDLVRQRGYIPLVDWASFDYDAADLVNQPNFSLSRILAGQHDEYIRQWAIQAKAWGHPFFLRFNWEMNGTWFPWSEQVNGNHQGEFVQVWRHVHDIFEEVGAKNVTWVWCPNVIGPETIPIESLYPGDEYVDWVCMDGYNTGRHPTRSGRWQSFNELFTDTYSALRTLSPDKPIMIAETASTEVGGSKAEWIRNAFMESLPFRFPEVKAIVWFNWNVRGIDWVIESSPASQRAFAEGIASRYYATNEYSELATSPIPTADKLRVSWHDLFFPVTK